MNGCSINECSPLVPKDEAEVADAVLVEKRTSLPGIPVQQRIAGTQRTTDFFILCASKDGEFGGDCVLGATCFSVCAHDARNVKALNLGNSLGLEVMHCGLEGWVWKHLRTVIALVLTG